ncbi:MAG TPA: hypothetical protein VNV88_13055 [Candidatus Solibacter sp.]|jgi:hypothetical protein|nr:hypothetical protein [Candidatus Solibacter sp.]
MSYVDPKTVLSPKGSVSDVQVIFNVGPVEGSWSVAKLVWQGESAVGIRWNGDEKRKTGTPQSRGNPTWFIVPWELAPRVLEEAERLASQANQNLAAGYRDMAADNEREAEAEEWCEGLIGDAAQTR